ncbi:unnamed protein product [Cyprideis torosa]|uniref:Uncharacterized protein n=1 Tax=Cyprideis torosa TaxID=163714 RepID=A0A7R8ZRK9_9CRUS|nr:unnamed protein product [Cyprideis torosa]CAG0894254.1 unnamed protein product [Cyprideis torosa]
MLATTALARTTVSELGSTASVIVYYTLDCCAAFDDKPEHPVPPFSRSKFQSYRFGLELGYIYYSTGKVEAVDWVDLKLYQHGEGGRSPRDHAFRFGAGGKTYHVDVMVLPPTPHLHFYGAEAKSKMVQRFCKFVLTSYGFNNEARTLKGQGFSDWIYNLDSWHWEGTENVG